jgi:hypothetical protein
MNGERDGACDRFGESGGEAKPSCAVKSVARTNLWGWAAW